MNATIFKIKKPLIVHNISREELSLFDCALDKHIDDQHPNSFSAYFNTLTQEQRRILTIAAGQQLVLKKDL